MVNTRRYTIDPEYRKEILEKAKLKWQNPEFKRKRRDYMRMWREKKQRKSS